MGATQSKLATTSSAAGNKGCPRGLDDLSVEEVRQYVIDLGSKYTKYGDAIAENAVDGEVLASIGCEEEMKETFECLEITNFLHQKVLLKEWNRARGVVSAPTQPHKATTATTTRLQRSETSFTTAASSVTDASEITLDTALSTSVGTHKEYARRLIEKEEVGEGGVSNTEQEPQPQPQEAQPMEMPRYPGAPPDIPITISVEHQIALEPLQLPKDETLLPPEAPELEPFRQLAQRVLRELHGSIAETNILDISHFENRKGMNNLATAFPPEANIPKPMRCHFDQPNDLEICRRFVLGQNEEYYEEYVPAEVAIANGLTEAGRYYGQVIKIGELRVGTICSIVEERNWSKTTDTKRQESLQLLATMMEQQLEQRQALLQRNQTLRQDIDHLKNNNGAGAGGRESVVLAPPYGPLKAVTSFQVASRETLFPYPREADVATHDNGHPTNPLLYTRRSSTLPSWHFTRQATTETERSHLHPDFWNHPPFPGRDMDPTPIGKHDMERVAMVNSLQILQIDPMSQEAQTIQSLLNMCGNLLEAEFVYISVSDHEHCYIFFPTYPKGRGVIPTAWQTMFTNCGEVLQRHPHTDEPIVWRRSRNGMICNYPVMSPNHQSFVVHDIERDQSLNLYKEVSQFGFYSGSPIVLRGQAVGVLCCLCQEARPDFERAQEVQQEQLAHLIAQQYDTWYLKREMQKLERERIMLRKTGPPTPPPSSGCAGTTGSNYQDLRAMCRIRTNLPEDYATLIFTSIQGFAALREANPEATEKALVQYSLVLRTKIAEYGGYEVSKTEDGSSFHIAFTDVVDAVKFCLQAQEALYAASWEQDLLALDAACDDPSRCFRGLRVRMAIHCGDVETSRSPQVRPGDVVYQGETLHVAKNLEGMCHGGQILLTSDVWNIASQLVESSLGSPQVVDLGSHVIPSKSGRMQDGITTKSLLQLVPKSLAHDYVESRRLSQQGEYDPNRRTGRTFPTIKTKKSVSASFHHAPFEGNKVVMLSVDTSEVESMAVDSRMLLVALSNRIRTILSDGCHSGYQCQDFLLAFDEVSDAVRFGLALQENLEKEDILEQSLEGRVRIGVQEGHFETMGPNPDNGKAEYFGEIVDRVPLIAEAAAPGCVYLGKEATGMDEFDLMPATNGFMLNFSGRRVLEGVPEEFALYKCHPCKSWYDQMLDNRRCNLSQPWRRY